MEKSFNFNRWRIWTLLVLSMVTVYSHRLILSVNAADICKELNITAATLGNFASITYYSYAIMQIPIGMLLDYIGPRKICFVGMMFAGIGSACFGLSTNIYFSYFSRFLVGIGTSVISISIFKVQSRWFYPEEFSSMSGKIAIVANLGAVFATFPLAAIVYIIGWRSSFHGLGIISTVLAVLILLFVRNAPSDYGYKEIVDTSETKLNIVHALKSVISNWATWIDFLILFSFISCTTALTGLWGIPYLMDVYEISKEKAAFYISFMIYGFVVGGYVIGKLDRLFNNRYKNIILVSTIINLFLWIYMLIIKDGKPSIQSITVIFFIMGMIAVSHLFAFTNVKEVNDIKYSGIAGGFINLAEFIGSSIINLFVGIMLDLKWKGKLIGGVRVYGVNEYRYAFMIFIIMSIISIIASLLMKDIREINK